ncbi:MAG: tetratricopeptide repeat protein [Akkermansiaceae bacterium]|nr:tetratricopeptide repeat protein [Akkermansiaceae bacterium]
MNNASLTPPTLKMLAVGLSLTGSFAYAGTEGYLSPSTAAGYSEVGPTAVYAGKESIDAREQARRREEQRAALQLLQEGRTAYQQGKYTEALDKYTQAWERVPHASATREMQEYIRNCISDASIAVAIQYAKVGRYDDAEQLLLGVLKRDPDNARAKKELSLVRDPVRNNPALTPEHVKNVEEVQRLLSLGWGAYELGKYDEAEQEFRNILRIDPYNIAAQRGIEAVQVRRQQYYRAQYNTYRSQAIAEVDAMWNNAQPLFEGTVHQGDTHMSSTGSTPEEVLKINQSLNEIRVTRVNFDNTPITDVVDFLLGEIRKSGAEHINVNFVKPAQPAPAAPVAVSSSEEEDEEDTDTEDGDDTPAPAAPVRTATAQPYKEPMVTISLQNLSLSELLKQICSQAGCTYVVRNTGVYIYTKGDPSAMDLVRKVWYDVPLEYLSEGEGGDEDGGGDDEEDAFTSGSKSKGKVDIQRILTQSASISWAPKDSFANYNRRTQTLTVYNTPDAIDAIDEMISLNRAAEIPMIKVTTKFIEVTQTNDEELSFDWVVNPFSVSNNGTTYLGGVTGASSSPNRTYNDFVTNGGSAYTQYHKNNGSWPVTNRSSYASSDDTITNGLMTGSLRSGDGALSSSKMDSLLEAGSPISTANASPAPGILSLSGIYNEGTFQMIMRGLSQKKGADVMSAPSLVLTPGGEVPDGPVDDLLTSAIEGGDGSARIEVVRRFIFPTEYEAPDIPDNTPNNNGNNNGNGSMSVPVAAPANPSAWGVEEVGLVMVLKVDERPANNIIKFNRFIVRVVDFEGFINYGSPIISGIANQNTIETIVLTENRIDQPVFSRKMVNTMLSLYDGHTVAIGGMVEDKVQKVEDKVPVFGDLPFIGRFFRSNAESHTRKNLTIFVTADIIDAMGKPVRSRGAESQGPGADAGQPGLFPEDGLGMMP